MGSHSLHSDRKTDIHANSDVIYCILIVSISTKSRYEHAYHLHSTIKSHWVVLTQNSRADGVVCYNTKPFTCHVLEHKFTRPGLMTHNFTCPGLMTYTFTRPGLKTRKFTRLILRRVNFRFVFSYNTSHLFAASYKIKRIRINRRSMHSRA